MNQHIRVIALAIALFIPVVAGAEIAAPAPRGGAVGELRVKIHSPEERTAITGLDASVIVRGAASVFGGVDELDLFLVLDTSRSLNETDPHDYRLKGAIELVESLPSKSDIQVGVVAFDRQARLESPLTPNRGLAIAALKRLNRHGFTNIAGGIETALDGFIANGRPGSTRVMLIFTDGRSNARKARVAMDRARAEGVVIHSLLLGADRGGQSMLSEVSMGTGGSFVQVTDPTKLPDAFMSLRTTGVDHVSLSVNGGEPQSAELVGGLFSMPLELGEGTHEIVATATSLDGRVASDSVVVEVNGQACAELRVEARAEGKPALSITQRSVQIVVDSSGSMWGQIDGVSKMEIAKQTIAEALKWMPPDLVLSLRAYGHQSPRDDHDCSDSELLVPPGKNNHAAVRSAIAGLKPRGQTPLAYTLREIARDLEHVQGERAVVLLTDGIESCGGDAEAAARDLQNTGPSPVHVISFGMGGAGDADLESLRAIATASGGKYLAANNADQLDDALSTTVGTSFRVMEGAREIAHGSLGGDAVVRLQPGDYTIELDSIPPIRVPVSLQREMRQNLLFQREGDDVSHTAWVDPTDYSVCERGRAPRTVALPASPDASASMLESDRAPKQRLDETIAVQRGQVEIWQNLRRGRKTDWGVVVKHPSMKKGSAMVWSGNDRAKAQSVAERYAERLRGSAGH